MPLTNTTTSYGSVAKIFHWSMAAIFLGLFTAAYTMMEMPPGDQKWRVYSLHKSFGLVILFLAFVRLIWRWKNPQPLPDSTMKQWETQLGQLTHFGLYGLMILMPISGYIMSVSGGYDVFFFGLPVPALIDPNLEIAKRAHTAHEWISYIILLAVGLHIAAAMWHHFVRKDNVLTRMLPK